MPWLTIIMWVLSYFMQTKSGVSAGKAALGASAVALGTYYLADPANKDNVLGVTLGGNKSVPGSLTPDGSIANPLPPGTSLGSAAIGGLSSVLTSWGPIGTVGAAAGLSGLFGNNKNWLLIGGLAVIALVLVR